MNCARATPYQTEIMRHIWKTGETDSRTTHNHLQTTPHPMSRATTINFINKMAHEGYLSYARAGSALPLEMFFIG